METRRTNPEPHVWQRAMNRVLAGLALGTVTLNFWGLNYLLPPVGQVLLLLGLRPLRRENRAFRVWWPCALAQTGLLAFQTLRRAAPGWQDFNQSGPGWALTASGAVLELAQLLCLWQGLREARRRAGLPPKTAAGPALAVWYILMTLLALAGGQTGWVFFLLLLAAYLFILDSLYARSREVDEAGYAPSPAPVRVPGGPLAGAFLGALLLGVFAVGRACNRLPMDWQAADPAERSRTQALSSRLSELGFPEPVLADLSAGDILACGDPVRVVSETRSFAMTHAYHAGAPQQPLTITGVAVELEGERERWRVFHHFQWADGATFQGSDAMQLWPAYRSAGEGWAPSGPPSGRVLCQRDGIALWAPYHFLGEETFTNRSPFFGTRTSTDLFAAFSFPRDGARCRGYVCYETAEAKDGWILDSWVNYAHARGIFQYPALSGKEWIQSRGISSDSEPFLFVQDALQFYPWEEDGPF